MAKFTSLSNPKALERAARINLLIEKVEENKNEGVTTEKLILVFDRAGIASKQRTKEYIGIAKEAGQIMEIEGRLYPLAMPHKKEEQTTATAPLSYLS